MAHPEIDNNEAHDQSPRMERTDVTPPSVSKIDEHNSLSKFYCIHLPRNFVLIFDSITKSSSMTLLQNSWIQKRRNVPNLLNM